MDYKKDREKYIGQKFGQLTIVKEVGTNKWKKPIVECLCDCGNKFTCLLGNIRFRNVHRCNSCRYLGMKGLKKGETGFNKLKLTYQLNAKSRNIEFNLDDETFKKLTSSNCYYCNCPPQMQTKVNNFKNKKVEEYGNYVYNGIDRLDNTIGYTNENSVTCCSFCNRAKSNNDKNFFLQKVKDICLNLKLL